MFDVYQVDLALQRLVFRIVRNFMPFMMLLDNESGMLKAGYRYCLPRKAHVQ